ncbi:phosphohydrolase [bacterium (Candidatus Blackallbacteria) CG17_big_fil_post_rev_8_21_14_2_50_48_46]|uniref:Phosphohydrolase n=1 Tax=bacterium (Candidatus Blackallbacteria) CG17_big_fil_post_rev_8_21_14_2_50_48_46 TaxID=2014261 RepID=A0A2M7G8V6_9BACT|nr:MAG: phosphohydrolase [bacterium (Candidatus Blackallbacteria) CG18_big_fil_WC_8_21_14_2_50_49_26]PIW18525.1 MAG: phosphohydrolase [bacterium (Candidatus Blackallbacteria) CG17_big_fil_post_rev_8_21_14_2_50_48_46]PIW46490.1 MAG: phosphohydrolase [bacterium (Candidatus Blackallbacteria) CG13_big_fil_rev_8_21_14_2_50_49_14]
MIKLSRLSQALCFAAEKHKFQLRKDLRTPYINHPLQVLAVLIEEGQVESEDILLAAVLHDTLEDTETTPEELIHIFGESVCHLIQEVSDNKSLPKAERKALQISHAPNLSPEAKQIKLADKICNLRDLLNQSPQDWPLERKQAYFKWAEAVGEGLKGVNPKLEAIFEKTLAQANQLQESS